MFRIYAQLFSGLLLTLSVFFLSACQSSAPQAMLEDYAARMSKVLDTNIELSLSEAALLVPPFPAKRDRTLATETLREGLWDVLDFRHCDMLSLIAERNSLLGKVMPPSQKMRYELRFIRSLQNCRQIIAALEEPDETDLAFQERLNIIYQTKQRNLPLEIWNGIYSSDEMSQHFKIGQPPLPLDTDNNSQLQQVLQQFTELAAIHDNNPITLPDWLEDVEAPYEVLYRSEFGAGFLSSLSMMTQTLDRTAQAIEERLARQPFCFPGHQPPRAAVLNTIFQKYYAAKVQPYMAIIQQQGQPWFEGHDALVKQLPTTKVMLDYQQSVFAMHREQSLWGQWVTARQRHTQAWQDILGQCNMMPSARP